MSVDNDEPEKELVEIIKNNPKCFLLIDTYFWALYKQDPYNNPHDWRVSEYDEWSDQNKIIDSLHPSVNNIPDNHIYGIGVLHALANICGIEIGFQ